MVRNTQTNPTPLPNDDAGLVERLRPERLDDRLGGVSTERMEGDNLAIVLCSFFDDGGPDIDDYGWSQAAVDGCDEVLAAIKAHYRPLADRIQTLSTALVEAREKAIEECARIAERYNNWDYVRIVGAEWGPGSPYDRGQQNAALKIAAIIRSLTLPEGGEEQ